MAPASLYVAVRLLSQGVVLVSSLLLATMLPIEAFAVIGSAFLIQTVLTPLSGFALHGGLERLFFTYDEAIRRRKVFTVYLASLGINGLVCAFAFLLLTTFLRMEFLTSAEVALTIASVLLMSVQYVPIVVMRCEGRLGVFAVMQMAFVLVTQMAILVAVYFTRNVDSFFIGTLIGSGVGFVMWCVWTLWRTGIVRLVGIGKELRYSLPSVPVGAIEAVQQGVDRFILQLAIPSAQFASYSLALRFSSPVSTIAQGTKAALYPILYRVADHTKIASILSDTTNLSIGLFGILVNLVIVSMAFVVTTLLGPDYVQVYPIFIVLIFGVFLRLQEVFLGVGADVTMKQHHKMLTLLPTVAVQIGVTIALTLAFGLWGAAAAFAINGAIRSLAMALLGQKLLPREIKLVEYGAIIVGTALPAATYLYLALAYGIVVGPHLLLSLVPVLIFGFVAGRKRTRS